MADYRPRIPAYDRATEVWTFQDVVDHVLDRFGLDRTIARDVRAARRAVLTAYRDLPNKHQWSYYEQRHQIRTVAQQTTGTIAYTHATRQVTLTGATWPTDGYLSNILIDKIQYKIQDYVSTTVITLAPDSNPGADVAAGTIYNLYRSAYQLPIGFRRAEPLAELTNTSWPTFVPPNEWLQYQRNFFTPTRPIFYTIRSAQESYGGMVLEFAPPPIDARVYELFIEVSPRPLVTDVESAGTVAVTGSAIAVVGTGTDFRAEHVGAMIRFPRYPSIVPTSRLGDLNNNDNLFVAQRVIVAVADATHATLDASASSSAITASKFTISDPIDCEATSMFTYFLRLCEMEFARTIRAKGSDDAARYDSDAKAALLLAMGSDSRDKYIGQSFAGGPQTPGDFRVPGALDPGALVP